MGGSAIVSLRSSPRVVVATTTWRRSSTMSFARWYRRAGSFSRARLRMRSTPGGTSRAYSRRGVNWS